jgi:hypothetical protein
MNPRVSRFMNSSSYQMCNRSRRGQAESPPAPPFYLGFGMIFVVRCCRIRFDRIASLFASPTTPAWLDSVINA